MNSNDNNHLHEPPHLRVGSVMHKVLKTPSSNGHVPPIITRPECWVWEPLPLNVPQTTSLVDYHLAITHKENVNFVAMPPFPALIF